MTALTSFSDYAWAQALAWTLIHFVWQGALVGLVAFVVLRTVKLSSAARYGVGVAALTAMLIAPMITYVVVAEAAPPAAPVETALDARPPLEAMEPARGGSDEVDAAALPAGAATSFVPFVLMAWAAGVLILSVRLAGGWWVARRLVTRSVRPVTHEVHAMARRVAGRLALDRAVRFAESTVVAVPVTVGWLKPVVLLPAAAMSGLSVTQVEALLAHELAHVRRHDYVVNLLQSAVETLLFFHPAVWWASNLIRTEREHCCDDLAVGVCDRLVYVSALSDLAAMSMTPRMAMAATNGSLLTRVRRILGKPSDDTATGSSFVPMMLAALLAAAFVPAVLAQTSGATGAGQAGRAREGVAVGVARGGRDGVVVGVRGGVGTGISGGVRQGVYGGVRPASGVARATTVQNERRASREQATEAGLQAEIAALEAAVQAATADLEGQRRRLAAGLISSEAMVDAEVALAELRTKLAAMVTQSRLVDREMLVERQIVEELADMRVQMQQAEQEVVRSRQLVERGLATEQTTAQAEQRLVELRNQLRSSEIQEEARGRLAEVAGQGAETIARLKELSEEFEARRRIGIESAESVAEQQARLKELTYALSVVDPEGDQTRLRLTALVTDEDARVQERDIIVIQISGESRMPTNYEVDTAGAIRLPLLGALQVRGLTIAQVRAAVTTMLADRQLAEDSTITVTLRRPGAPGVAR